MITKEKEMEISKPYRPEAAPREPKSALRGFALRFKEDLCLKDYFNLCTC